MNKLVTRICPFCKASTQITIPIPAYEAWAMGVCIQKAWPLGSATDRETLISGICPACQEKTFDETESEESDEQG